MKIFINSGNSKFDMRQECGIHVIQRIPPTERRGRVHTSTVTVAVLDAMSAQPTPISDDDFIVEWFNGTIGAGGQNHQKTQNCARVKHIPTGIVRTGQSRSRKNSLEIAMDALKRDINSSHQNSINEEHNSNRKEQIGSGMRGDKIRTYRFQEDIVTDHVTGKKCSVSKVMKGNFDLLW